MILTHTWTDIYGSAYARFSGRAGGHTWLVASAPALAKTLQSIIQSINGKGSIILAVHSGITPLLQATKELNPRGVVIINKQNIHSGSAVATKKQLMRSEYGLSYKEGGDFAAWQESFCTGASLVADCAEASALASLGASVIVVSPENLKPSLESWLDATPHGR